MPAHITKRGGGTPGLSNRSRRSRVVLVSTLQLADHVRHPAVPGRGVARYARPPRNSRGRPRTLARNRLVLGDDFATGGDPMPYQRWRTAGLILTLATGGHG